ncbi:MAG: hypothetical protein ACTSUV_03930 [Candidatus Ranarchaeia archaeon]
MNTNKLKSILINILSNQINNSMIWVIKIPPLWGKWASSLKDEAKNYMQKLELENEQLQSKVKELEAKILYLERENLLLRNKLESDSQQN